MRERTLPPGLLLRSETDADADAVEALYVVAFGPGRHARTAYRLRGDRPHDSATAFVAERSGLVIGAIRQIRVAVGDAPAYLLGPLAVAETAAKQGIGRSLLTRSIDAARLSEADAIILVGDPAFYAASGFRHVGDVVMPGPVEKHRVMMLELRGPVAGRLALSDWGETRAQTSD